MSRINLLPWREELRRERNQKFYVTTAMLGVFGLAIMFIANVQVSAQLNVQTERNNYVIERQKELEEKIVEIDKLKKERSELESRMNIIQDLQGNRSVVVRLFDEIAKKTPDGVYLKKIDRSGSRFTIKGVAEANNRISNMMRNLDQSPWFTDPNLTSVVTDDSRNVNTFDLSVLEEDQKKRLSENDNNAK